MSRNSALNQIANFALFVAGLYAAVILTQRWLLRDPRTGQKAPSFNAVHTSKGRLMLPPTDGKPSVFVFWATWCGPCRLELSRLKSAVENGEIPADRIFAISLHEPLADVKRFASEQAYPFEILADETGASGELYGVRVTPTIVHLGVDGQMEWIAEGLHPLATSRAKSHLKSGSYLN